MNTRKVSTLVAASLIASVGIMGCSSSESSTPATNPTASPMNDQTGGQEMNPDITPEQTAFVDDLLATPLPQDEATARIEEAGYTWRLGTIDGEPQAVTMDYRIDRLTLTTQDGLVIDATWG